MDLETLSALFRDIQSTQNDVRKAAEEYLEKLVANDPSNAALTLLTVATTTNTEIATDTRQASLLFLKKIIPKYWSAGFGSFVGPAISQEVKHEIRSGLLNIVVNSNGNLKILNSVTYTIVQIAAVDFPDEWPDLLKFVFTLLSDESTKDQTIAGLILLHDLFEDIITDEMFFTEDVGFVTITRSWEIISDPSADSQIRKHAAALYKLCLIQLQNPEFLDDPNHLPLLQQHFSSITTTILQILTEFKLNVHDIELKTFLVQISNTLIEEFPPEFIPSEFPQKIQRLVISDLNKLLGYYTDVIINGKEDTYIERDPYIVTEQVVSNLLIEQYQVLTTAQLPIDDPSVLEFLNATVQYSMLPFRTEEDWTADFNNFVTVEMDVYADYTVRHVISDYILDSEDQVISKLASFVFDEFLKLDSKTSDWRLYESLGYLLMFCFASDHNLRFETSKILGLLEKLNQVITDDSVALYSRARSTLLLPKIFAHFSESINSSQFAIKIYENLLSVQNWPHEHLAVSVLITLINSSSFLKTDDIAKDKAVSIWQSGIYRLVDQLLPESEEDTPPVLAEAIAFSLGLGEKSIVAVRLLMRVGAIDPANVQLFSDIEEGLELLLEDIDVEKYVALWGEVEGAVLGDIESSKGVWSAMLELNLDILTTLVKRSPVDKLNGSFSELVDKISEMILVSKDDQILQSSNDLYNAMIDKFHPDYFNLETTLQILNKLLDESLSDTAVLNVGTTVVTVLTKFGSKLQGTEYFSLILEATTKRLLLAEHQIAIENFLRVLCYMVELDAEQTLLFLNNFGAVEKVLNFWLSHIEPTDENVKDNLKAIMKLFISADQGLWSVLVEGDEVVDFDSDLIVTRSMRKQQKFQQIPVPVKIIKVLISALYNESEDEPEEDDGELDFEEDHDDDHDHDHEHSHTQEGGDDDEGWEDVEDDVEFDKLQKYINEEGPSTQNDPNPELRALLVNFFKEIASRNTLNFKEIYDNALTDEERSILTKNIV